MSVCTQNKCTRYWPDMESNKTYGQVHVVNLKETPNPHYILREFLVHHEDVSGGGEGGVEEGGGREWRRGGRGSKEMG